MKARVIGLGGRLRAGKDAAADYLVEQHGFVKLGMSDALHEALLAINPIVEAWGNGQDSDVEVVRYSEFVGAYGYVEAKKHPEVRRLLQMLGTEVGRNMIGEQTWTNIMAGKISRHLSADTNVVVTGIRFGNELRLIHQFAGKTVWVERPGLDRTSASLHASENGVTGDMFDEVLINGGTLEDLYDQAARLAGVMGRPSEISDVPATT